MTMFPIYRSDISFLMVDIEVGVRMFIELMSAQ